MGKRDNTFYVCGTVKEPSRFISGNKYARRLAVYTLKLLYFTWPLRMAEKNKTHFVKNEFNFTSILHVFKKFWHFLPSIKLLTSFVKWCINHRLIRLSIRPTNCCRILKHFSHRCQSVIVSRIQWFRNFHPYVGLAPTFLLLHHWSWGLKCQEGKNDSL